MRRSGGFALGCFFVALAPGLARADVAPPGLVPVKHSIRVDVEGALPPGKVLLMAGTFEGAAVIDTGTLVPKPGSLPEGTSACGTCATGAHVDDKRAACSFC